MSRPYPFKEIRRWADAPDDWQWKRVIRKGYPGNLHQTLEYADVTFREALALHDCNEEVILVPRRNMVPANLLPEGWEVERLENGQYKVHFPTTEMGSGTYGPGSPLYHLLRHIDSETDDE